MLIYVSIILNDENTFANLHIHQAWIQEFIWGVAPVYIVEMFAWTCLYLLDPAEECKNKKNPKHLSAFSTGSEAVPS